MKIAKTCSCRTIMILARGPFVKSLFFVKIPNLCALGPAFPNYAKRLHVQEHARVCTYLQYLKYTCPVCSSSRHITSFDETRKHSFWCQNPLECDHEQDLRLRCSQVFLSMVVTSYVLKNEKNEVPHSVKDRKSMHGIFHKNCTYMDK